MPNQRPSGTKAQRVYLVLRDQITSGALPEGSSLPAEQMIAGQHRVSRVTVRRALEALAKDGLIETRAGRRACVRAAPAREPALAADLTTLIPQLVEIDRQTEARLISFGYEAPTPHVRRALGADGEVQTAIRIRSIDGQPFSHLTTHVPERIARSYTSHDLASQPLFRLLERAGVEFGTARQSVSATLAAPEIADHLGVAIGSALLAIQRVVYDTDGDGVEFLSALYRPDLFRLDMALNRVGAGDNRHWAPVFDVRADQGGDT